MGVGRSYSVALLGLNGYIVEVEADIGQTLPNFVILGLPDASLNEAKERIRSAAQNSGIPLSRRKITANLIPASLPKRGSGFDLAITMAVLRAAGDIRSTEDTVFISELGLDGRLRPVRGILPAVMAAVQAGHPKIVVAHANVAEAELVPGAVVRGYKTLARLAFDFGANPQDLALDYDPADGEVAGDQDAAAAVVPDLCDVSGQGDARRALEVAAAGAHHVLLCGPPGAGKTMLAERLPGLLPDLGDQEAMEVTAIHSLSAVHVDSVRLLRRPPFENPHHSATAAAIIGGGSGLPRPGAASRAHRGVLFLDEAPEYERRVLDALRQPLESGELVIHRSAGTAAYPARFQLVLAANPCPCGKATGKGVDCTCTPVMRRRYFGRMSGPLLDRVDIQLQVERVSLADFGQAGAEEDTATVASRVQAARSRQRQRLGSLGMETNSQVPGRVLRGELRLPSATTKILDTSLERGILTARGYDRVLRLAWTLADLGHRDQPHSDDIGQALGLRQAVAAA
ncbi:MULTISPECIES: YifB family Mg chelatase-like AAA ATPase [Arthrobacter]|uniref:Magnesium chelatase family protein n=1 Tax=Arthrobacter bambusae TaxID=1338426 RepID=A0AAW8DG31_9MICC|nr:YifB family Mg chelatase-like AAA ATPase [Arthrobacter bambusae]MDP9904872.1 magnesium chelatase family protein [Arthrobacter bambusae]MDQ0129688.1 magnesium chelatase family protein [Arthrobacter bambusae]MDQ0181068.1 magnesium chelatase family protein [Arthrobacter bambusae]